MAFLQVTNRAISKLTSDISSTATSFTVTTGDGALFPTGNFIVTIENERILVGSRTNDTFSSLTRGYDGTTASSHSAGASVELRIVAKHIQELQDFCNTAGQPNGLATLNSNGLVVQNPANATSTPTANAIVMAGSDGKIADGWNVQSIATTASPTFAGLTIDTNTLYVDGVNHRVGIRTTTPARYLEVQGETEIMRLTAVGSPSNYFSLYNNTTRAGWIGFGYNFTDLELSNETSGNIILRTIGNPRLIVTNGGNIFIGGTSDRATMAGTNVLNIFNGTVPVGTLTNGISIYSSGGNPYVMDSAGNAQPLGVSGTPTFANIIINGYVKHTPTSAPSSPVEGMVYYDSSAKKLKVYTGSVWETISSS